MSQDVAIPLATLAVYFNEHGRPVFFEDVKEIARKGRAAEAGEPPCLCDVRPLAFRCCYHNGFCIPCPLYKYLLALVFGPLFRLFRRA